MMRIHALQLMTAITVHCSMYLGWASASPTYSQPTVRDLSLSNSNLLPLIFSDAQAPPSEPEQARRHLLSGGTCSRKAVNYTISGSPFLSSSLSFDPIHADTYTEVTVIFTMAHQICSGDQIVLQLPGFTLDPPPGSAVDPDFLDTGTDKSFSKYVGAWQESKARLTLMYSDSDPVAPLQRQYVSLSSTTGFRLPPKGLPSNTSQLQIAIHQGYPSTIRSGFYPIATTQASVLLSNVSLTFLPADTLSDIFPALPGATHSCASNFSCDDCDGWTYVRLECGGACSENLTQHQRDVVCSDWLGAPAGSAAPSSSSGCFPATAALPELCREFQRFCGADPRVCPSLTPAAEALAFSISVRLRARHATISGKQNAFRIVFIHLAVIHADGEYSNHCMHVRI